MGPPIPDNHVVSFTSFARARSRARDAALFLFSVALLLAGGVTATRGQSPLDGFDPNTNGRVRVVVVQPDSKILIGGDFTTLSPNGGAAVMRNRIARLNPDGTLDTTFNPEANDTVYAIALQTNGKILVGGFLTTIGGQMRNHIARLNPDGTLDSTFNPDANDTVFAIALQADGKILAGGDFTSIGGQTRNRIARLDATVGLADSFDPNADGRVLSIVVQADGKILAGGEFTVIDGQTRNHIARFDGATGLADSFDPNASHPVYAIAVQADGKILAGGYFRSIGGQTRNRIARLDASTGLADSFDPNAGGRVLSIVVQADGKILASGDFFDIGGEFRNNIARVDAVTGLADSLDPNSGRRTYAIAVQADGKILVGGSFTTLTPSGGAAVPRGGIARLETDGRLDQTVDLQIAGTAMDNAVSATAVQPDGKILIGGLFTNVLGLPRNNIARLNTDGTLDTAFNPNADGNVFSITVQADGKILTGGRFSTIGGQARNRIARLDATTGLADSFNPAPNGLNTLVSAIAVQADGKIFVGGYFTTIGGQPRRDIARLDATTGLADSFNPNVSGNGAVYAIAVQTDGKVLAGGDFINIGGQARSRIARLDAVTGLADAFSPEANGVNCVIVALAVQTDGKILAGGQFTSIGGQIRHDFARLDATSGMADSFDPNADNRVHSIALQADGKMIVGGDFTIISGVVRNRIARLDALTGLADSFNPNTNADEFNAGVFTIALQADGKILAGGGFTSVGGQMRLLFARLSNDTPALQDLIVTQTTITWARGGSSQKFRRVTFEYSTDNVNYTPLGDGTAAGSNWTLTGLSFPIGQNIYLRARGYYRSGYGNNSGSITESVRNAFLNAPLQLTTAVSRKTHVGAGDFDIPLPLTDEPGVECRSSGGAHTLVFSLSNNPVSGNASVTGGIGSVSGSPTFANNTMTVNLTGISDVQKVTVTLSGVTDSFTQVLPNTAVSMNVLAGDTNGNKTVNASDVGQTKAQSGIAVTAANFRQDVTPNGTINASDIGLVKSRSGQFVP